MDELEPGRVRPVDTKQRDLGRAIMVRGPVVIGILKSKSTECSVDLRGD